MIGCESEIYSVSAIDEDFPITAKDIGKATVLDPLLAQRTPHSTTGATPAELLMKRRLRTRLSLVKPDLSQEIENEQNKQKQYNDLKNHKDRQFSENDIVRVRNTQAKGNIVRWILGRVVKVCGPRTYLVKTGLKSRYVHADHLIRAHDQGPNEASESEISVPELCDQSVLVLDTELVSNDVLQPTNEESEPSPCKNRCQLF